MDKIIDFILTLMQKLPYPYIVMIIVIFAGTQFLKLPLTKELFFGPEWYYAYDREAEKVIFETDTELKSGEITVRTQLEFKYENKVFFILEIQGLYNKNQVNLSNVENYYADSNDKEQKSRFYLTVEKQQRDKLDAIEAII